jgi:hypothetical protein
VCARAWRSQLATVDAATALQRRGVPFFYAASLTLQQLADPAFVDAYLRAPGGEAAGGSEAADGADESCVCTLSAGTPLDRADAVALTPDGAPSARHIHTAPRLSLTPALLARPPKGTLHLSLTRDTYESLGVPGARAPVRRGGRLGAACARYGALLRLPGARFAPGTRQYERVTACARDAAAPNPFRLLLARTLAGCSARVAFPPSADAVTHAMRPVTRRITRLTLPPLGAAFGGDAASAAASAADASLLSALHTWLGAVACGVAGTVATAAVPWRHEPTGAAAGGEDAAADDDHAVASSSAGYEWPLQAPWAGERDGWAEAHRWRGLLTPAHVSGAVATAAAAVASGAAPWAAVSVWGFADSPVAWLPAAKEAVVAADGVAREQPALPPLAPRAPGDNDYILLLLPHARWLLLTMDTSDPV